MSMDQVAREAEAARPGTKRNMLAALSRVRVSHLHDAERFDFAGLMASDD